VNRDVANATDAKSQSSNGADGRDRDVANATADPLSAVAALAADDKVRAAVQLAEKRQAGEEKRKADLERPVTVALPDGIIHGDFYTLSRSIPDDSVATYLMPVTGSPFTLRGASPPQGAP
jgi:hypothetical protein